jgi:uncharacterized protein involved in exopolysaccharide biosynthesis
MTLRDIKRLIRRNWLLLVTIPVITAISIYVFNLFQEKEYTSDTVIYTGISSGTRIASASETSSPRGADGAYANLISLINSRDTKDEVVLRLLASHIMLREYDPAVMNEETYDRLNELFSPTLKAKLRGASVEETTENLKTYYRSNSDNVVYHTMNSYDPLYSLEALTRLTAYRMGSSDLVKVEYVANDPAVTQQTLEIMTEVFTRKNKELFAGQNENVLVYFDEATQRAYEKLQQAEQKLFEFNKANNIVDYDQQIAATSSDKTAMSDKLSTLEMQYAGAFSAMKSAEETLKRRGAANLQSQQIMNLRSQLSKINGEILELELNGKGNSGNAAKIDRLKKEAAQVSADIKSSLDSHYANTHSAQGAPVAPLLDEYVRNTILVEELKSQLELMRKQQDSFAGQYKKLVPLGAEIRKIRREVEVAEQEYMAQLDGLKQSKLSQQNIELASQLRIIDPPYYPINPSNTNLVLLMLFGFFGALLLTGAGVFTADMVDSTLHKPAFAAKVTSFPVMGVIPDTATSNSKKLAKAKQAEEQLVRQLLLKIQQKKVAEGPFVIGMLSSHSGEGKSAVTSTLTNRLQQLGISSLRLLPDTAEHQTIYLDNTTAFYSPLQGVGSGVTVADLAGNRIYNHNVVLVEFPALLENTYPVSLLQHLDLILVTVKADRSWQHADRIVFENIQKVTGAPIELVLNGVLPDYVEEFTGAPVRPLSVTEYPQVEAPKEVDKWESEPAIMNT